MEPVLKFLEEQMGLGALALLIAVVFICGVVWKIAVEYTKKTDKIDSLPCERHGNSIETLTENLDRVDKTLARLSALPCERHDGEIRKIDLTLAQLEEGQEGIYRMMQLLTGQSPAARFTQSHSPISLSEMGREVADELGFDRMLADNWSSIASIVGDRKNPYDIQMEFISRFMTDFDRYLDPESIDRIKTDAFRRGVPLIEYLRMLGIMARDRYFAEYSIDAGQIDSGTSSGN